MTATGFHRLQVRSVDRLTDDAVALTFDVPDALRERFAFSAGQHLTLRRVDGDEDLRRTYSVCSSAVSGPLRVAVKRLEGGALSTWLTDALEPGEALEVLPPAGRFGPLVDRGRARRYGLVGAGSGITPLLSIAATVLEVEPDSTVALLFGNRTTREVMFLEELADLKDRYPDRLELVHVLSREQQGSELLSGRLDADRLTRLLATLLPVEDVDEWYLCGPFGVVTEGSRVLREHGVPPADVHTELFHAEPPPPRPVLAVGAAAGTTSVVAVLHGRATTLTTDRETPLLDAVLAVRADAPYACRGGVCGTCRARLVEGTVEMAVNYALEPDELVVGIVLTCQSRATSDGVRVEFLST